MSESPQKENESLEGVVRKYHSPQWPESIPEYWTWSRVDFVSKEVRHTINPTDLEYEEVFHYSIPIIEETGDGRIEDPQTIKSKKLLLDGGEVLISKLNPGKSRVITASSHRYSTLASSEFISFNTNEDQILTKYMEFLFKSEPVRQYLEGIATSATRSHKRVNPSEIRQLNFPLPPLATQRSLLSYLEYQITRIDELIKKKEQLVELLKQRRNPLLEKKLRAPEDKDNKNTSGSDFCSDKLPQTRIKYLSKKITSGPRDWAKYYNGDGDGTFIRITNLQKDQIDISFEDVKRVSPPANQEAKRANVLPGDILVSITADIVMVGIVPEDIGDAYINQHIASVRPSQGINPKWLAYCLASPWGQEQLLEPIRGGTKAGLGLSDVGNVEIPVPNEKYQDAVINEVEQELQITTKQKDIIQNSIDLLEEKRQALITAAVTGQIDLSDWDSQEDQELPA